ncbi:hypothetical protein ANN_01758 [Periplaneta americana]|uniref:Per a allergen n=1 Tax=Periplaneta americana TaxID=6978 RepID=A0ABQ8TVJ2_PERAM|nr:hypothetical protein ANN_01758 [Periplaneta americana]
MLEFTNQTHGPDWGKCSAVEELGVFQDSLQTLKMAQTKFQDSGESLEKVTPDSEGKTIMVPLTGSDVEGAKEYFKRKVNFVTEQMEKIQQMGLEKSKIREAVMDVMEVRLQAQLSVQQQQRQQQAAKS